MALPAWLYRIWQKAAARKVTVPPETVHVVGVSDVSVTGLPEPPPVPLNWYVPP